MNEKKDETRNGQEQEVGRKIEGKEKSAVKEETNKMDFEKRKGEKR